MKAKIDMLSTFTRSITIDVNKALPLTAHFIISEMANLAGDSSQPQYLITPQSNNFMKTLELFRLYIGGPVRINSGYRQEAYNRKIGGDANSPHIYGTAADIRPDYPVDKIVINWFRALDNFGLTGAINIYPDRNYYHLEAYSDVIYDYKTHVIRVYNADDLAAFENTYGAIDTYLKVKMFKR